MADSLEASVAQFDVVVIGAGVSGMHFIHLARQRGWTVQCYEAGSGVGGTWYWNRYPGCRVDIESLEYSYSFSEELYRDWEWTERFAAQPELERYLNHVADRFSLRPHIRLNTRVTAAHFDEASSRWTVRTDAGDVVSARFLISATGFHSTPVLPEFEGLDQFRGLKLQTALWPQERPALAGKRVGVIGTGASGVQVIQTLASQVAQLTVFQRTAAYSVPQQNCPMDPQYQSSIKSRFTEMRKALSQSFAGTVIVHSRFDTPSTRSALAVSEDERRREFEDRWASGGLSFYNAFSDLLVDDKANATLDEFLKEKLRSRVRKPGVAEKLTPRGYPVLTRRLANDNGYAETFDRDNVELVDVTAEPIRHFTADGLVVGEREIQLDVIIFATGFDMGTGALARIDLRGRAGRSLNAELAQGGWPHLGMMATGYPNLFVMNGVGAPFYNPMVLCEQQGQWILRCIDQMQQRGARTVEPTPEAVDAWSQYHDAVANMTLFTKGKNHYMGDNIDGKPRRSLYFWGGFPLYAEKCDAALADEKAFRFEGQATPTG